MDQLIDPAATPSRDGYDDHRTVAGTVEPTMAKRSPESAGQSSGDACLDGQQDNEAAIATLAATHREITGQDAQEGISEPHTEPAGHRTRVNRQPAHGTPESNRSGRTIFPLNSKRLTVCGEATPD